MFGSWGNAIFLKIKVPWQGKVVPANASHFRQELIKKVFSADE